MAFALDPTHPVYQVRHVRQREVPWMLRRNIWTGVLGAVGLGFTTSGVFFTVFCQQAGMQAYQFGVLATLVSLAVLVQPFAASVGELCGQRKYPWFVLEMASRLVRIPILLALFLPFSPWLIVGLLAVASVMHKLNGPLWLSWTWDYIPARAHGRFQARRTF